MGWLIAAALFLGFWVMILTGTFYSYIEEQRKFRLDLIETLDSIVLVPCEDDNRE